MIVRFSLLSVVLALPLDDDQSGSQASYRLISGEGRVLRGTRNPRGGVLEPSTGSVTPRSLVTLPVLLFLVLPLIGCEEDVVMVVGTERLYNAVLPTYHRFDVSVERPFDFGAVDLTLLGSLINVYDRRNIFSVYLFTLRRVDQLPFIPSFGLRVGFN